MRVVSLTCSNTEIVCALGCADCLVGVDSDSDHPPRALVQLPRLGRDLEVDAEAVAALQPDLVLASLTVPGHERVVQSLRALDLPVLAPEPVSLADVYRDILEIADRLGVRSRGERVVASMRAVIPDAAPVDPRQPPGPALLVQWWPKPVIAPGRLSWVDDLLRAAGARNPLGTEDCKSRPMEDAEVAAVAPDAFVMSWCGVSPQKYRPQVVLRNPAWQALPAIRSQRVYAVSEAHLGRPGPRLVEGYRALRRIVQQCGG